MKVGTYILMLFYLMLYPLMAQNQLMLSEIADPGDVYQARFVEIYNNSDTEIDFSTETWYLCCEFNGGSSWGDILLSGTIPAHGLFRVAYNATDFEAAYGFAPEQVSGYINGNGDDAYFIYYGGDHTTGTLVDIYGEIDTDGTGTAWEYTDCHAERNAGVSAPNTTWTASEWTIEPADVADMTPNDTSLPVTLALFTAFGLDNEVRIEWATESEIDNAGFNILRKRADEENYTAIASYEWDPTLVGRENSNEYTHYQYSDREVVNGVTYNYILQDVSVNGVISNHGPISVTPRVTGEDNGGSISSFKLYDAYPNPFNPSTQLRFDIPASESGLDVNLSIYNIAGAKVRELYSGHLSETVNYSVHWDGCDANHNIVPAGLYIAVLRAGSYSQATKLLLMK